MNYCAQITYHLHSPNDSSSVFTITKLTFLTETAFRKAITNDLTRINRIGVLYTAAIELKIQLAPDSIITEFPLENIVPAELHHNVRSYVVSVSFSSSATALIWTPTIPAIPNTDEPSFRARYNAYTSPPGGCNRSTRITLP